MGQRKKRAIDRRRQEEKEEVQAVIPNWSELCPDLLRYVSKGLSFTDLNRAKSVCSSWYSASRGCVPKPNQIPWLILFPFKEKGNNNSGSCVLFVPEDKGKVYKTRDLGVDFVRNCCLASYGSWILMIDNHLCNNLYILNPLTCERIDLPDTISIFHSFMEVCFWIDNITKDYLVFLTTSDCTMFIKKGVNKWHELMEFKWYNGIVYNHKNRKLYILYHNDPLMIWDFSGDKPRKDGFPNFSPLSNYDLPDWRKLVHMKRRLAIKVSGDVLMVACCQLRGYKTWRFHIYKADHVNREWVEIDSLGDEALILDMGVTVVSKDIPGIKRNSIYFSGFFYGRKDPNCIFVFDLTTQKMEPLPQCVSSSILFSDARWFFPGFNG